jgi:hypothetical protein
MPITPQHMVMLLQPVKKDWQKWDLMHEGHWAEYHRLDARGQRVYEKVRNSGRGHVSAMKAATKVSGLIPDMSGGSADWHAWL